MHARRSVALPMLLLCIINNYIRLIVCVYIYIYIYIHTYIHTYIHFCRDLLRVLADPRADTYGRPSSVRATSEVPESVAYPSPRTISLGSSELPGSAPISPRVAPRKPTVERASERRRRRDPYEEKARAQVPLPRSLPLD